MKIIHTLTATLALVLAGQAQRAHAQQAASTPADPGTPAAGNTSTGIADIVVTAQRRSENLQRAAVAVSVLGADSLLRANVTQSSQLTALVPALQVSTSGATNLFYLRGVGTFAVNAFSDPAIAFNYDGVYVGRPSATTGVFYDVERVEVLKGPQGTLYGRNATGGAINILPAKPVIGETGGNASVTVGNYGTVNLQGAVNLSLSNSAALRVSGIYAKHNGYLSDGANDEDGKGGRIQLLVKPAASLSVKIGADYYHAGGKGGGAALVATIDPFTRALSPSPLGRDVGLFDPRAQAILTGQYNFQVKRNLGPLSPSSYQDSTFWGVNADINWTTDAGTLTFVPAYRRAQVNARNGVTSFISDFNEDTKQTSVELRFASPNTGMFRYLLGGYYYKENSTIRDGFLQQALANFLTGDLSTRSAAVFGRATVAVSDQLRFTGGLRYTDDRKTINGAGDLLVDVCLAPACTNGLLLGYGRSVADMATNMGLIGPLPSPVPAFGSIYVSPTAPGNIVGRNVAPINAVQSNSKLTYRLGVEYDAGPRSLLYASFETGYRGGGFSFAADKSKQLYRPETISAFTIGFKNRFMDNRLQLNAEVFYWRYKDQQVAHLGVDSTGSSAFFTENIGNSRNFGGEIEVQFAASPRTLLSANIQYLDAEYTQFSYTTPTPPPTRCKVMAGAVSTVDCSGLQALRAPRWTMNFGLRHTVPVGGYKVVFDGTARYQSSTYVGFELLDAERQLGYWSGSASLAFMPKSEAWSLSAFVNNIGDQRPWGDIIYNGNAGILAGSPGAPRLFGLRASGKF
ncbi:iron complex outermembrane receptor protein [Novosphingobium sp. SG751A]|uniref:TonB-dependent receptor n=1 Tax=Novosphingobium sp. SG751A TaxID=2587000 RepID=UPI001553D940|nr:TonB-dependent receptor [Novosphingobium sp. SG751A]NOW48892.1 iron complex outermembrane receptor protein [Novosphingobium sp. SG751A]